MIRLTPYIQYFRYYVANRYMKTLPLAVLFCLLSIVLYGQTDSHYLQQVLENLNEIRSATYFRYQSATAPYDTVALPSYNVLIKEYDNPSDRFVGASIAQFLPNDTSKMIYFYDGKARSYLNWENKTIPIDSFQNNRYPFRTVYPPFITEIKSLIKHTIETQDSTGLDCKDFGDSVLIRISFFNKYIEVVGNHIVYTKPPDLIGDKWSKYDIWINNRNGLPYRLQKIFPDKRWLEVCKMININKTKSEALDVAKYFPADFTILYQGNKMTGKIDLLGKVAENWILKDVDNHEFSLSDLKSRILMFHFTGIGCGPCHLSVPFLKEITIEYEKLQFELVAIETWNANIPVIKKYIETNGISYKYLIATEDIKQNYNISSVPVFIILDETRAIRNIIKGYEKGSTDKEIRNAIDHLLDKQK
jgi:thiol-disulfide isomerase/thioredoxin